MPKSKKNISKKKKNRPRTKKNRKKPKINTNLATIYKDHEFGGKYPVISFDRYVAQGALIILIYPPISLLNPI